MKSRSRSQRRRHVIGLMVVLIVGAAYRPSAAATDAFSQEELEQMLAPIALYPDSLLSQVLMASTYPLEIVQADRWAKANKDLKGDELAKALEGQSWDPSVRSLVNFPDVLASLSEKLEWTTKIGDAFLADQKVVLDTVQKLRKKAKEAGNLESSEKLKVTTEAASDGVTQVIVVESPSPQVIYVPTYDPVVVYGPWPYPAYPPPVYYTPPYYTSGALLGFGIGFACGAAWGYAWGDCDWHGGHCDVDFDQNININNSIDRDKFKAEFNNREGGRRDQGGRSEFRHDPSHRKGVEYRDQGTANRFGGESRAQAAQTRDAYRGRADADRANLSRDAAAGRIDSGGIGGSRPSTADRPGNVGGAGGGATRPSTADRPGGASGGATRPSTADRPGGAGAGRSDYSRPSTTQSRDGALGGSSYGGGAASRDSSRGSYSRSGGSMGGGSRGGGSRGGGGGRGRR